MKKRPRLQIILTAVIFILSAVGCSSRHGENGTYHTPKSVVIDELSTEGNRLESENQILKGENRILSAKLDEEIRERALIEQENRRLLIALDNLQSQ